ncbi:MAG: MFS transporter, partial [Chloroflexota bacterium]
MIAMFLTPGNMRWLLISRGVRSFSQALLVITAPLYFAALGNSSTQVGLLLSVGAVGSTVLTLTTGFAADRVGRRPLLVLIAVLSGLGAAVLGLNGAFALLALGGALCTVGGGGGATSGGNWGPFFPAEQPLIAGSVPDARRGEAFAAISTVGVIGGAAGALVAGVPALLQAQLKMPELSAYRVMFWVIAATAVLLTVTLLPIREPAVAR